MQSKKPKIILDECVILQFLPRLRQNQLLVDQIYLITQLLYPYRNPNISWEAIHYLGTLQDPYKPPPAILKFSFRQEKDDFFQKFIQLENAQKLNSVFAQTRISNSLSKPSMLRRSLLLSHHIHLCKNREPSSLKDTPLKLHGIHYTVDYRSEQITSELTLSTRQVEEERRIFLESRFQHQQPELQPRTYQNRQAPIHTDTLNTPQYKYIRL